jgi:putative PEP-CTERM system TPR-repeat lipoprotein
METSILAKPATLTAKTSFFAIAASLLFALAGCSAELTEQDYITRAEAAWNEGDMKSMAIELKNALRLNPRNAEARYLLGQTYYMLGDAASSEKELLRARELGIPDNRVYPSLVRAVLLTANFEAIVKEYPVLDHLNEQSKATVLAARGMAQLNLAKLDEARTSFDAALELDPEEAFAMLGQAYLARILGDIKAATEWLNTAQELDRTNAESWSMRGDLEEAAGNREAAEAAYGKAIDLSPSPDIYLLQRALLRIDMGNLPAARQDIARLSPQQAGKFYAQGLIQLKVKDYLKAQASFEQSLRKSEIYPPAQYYLGLTHVLLGNEEQAVSNIRRFLSQVPESTIAAMLLTKLEIRQGDMASAQALMDPIFMENPEKPEALDLMAGLELMQGHSSVAISRYRALVAQSPGSAATRSNLGLAMILGGNILPKAERNWRKQLPWRRRTKNSTLSSSWHKYRLGQIKGP